MADKCTLSETEYLNKLEQSKFIKILKNKNETYYAILLDIVKNIQEIIKNINLYFNYYTDHSARHSLRIIKNLELLLGENGLNILNPSEMLILGLSAFLHDIGMLPISTVEAEKAHFTNINTKQRLETLQKIRDNHHSRSYKIILGEEEVVVHWDKGREGEGKRDGKNINIYNIIENIFNKNLGYAPATIYCFIKTIAEVSKYHRESGWKLLSHVVRELYSGACIDSEPVRKWLLAFLLMLADELDIGPCRSVFSIADTLDVGIQSIVKDYIVHLASRDASGNPLKHHILNNIMITTERVGDTIIIKGELDINHIYENSIIESLFLLSKINKKINEILMKIPFVEYQIYDLQTKKLLSKLPTKLILLIKMKVNNKIYELNSNITIMSDPKLFNKILSSNLYSDDLRYMLRELISNSIDSYKRKLYKEKNIKENYIKIKLYKEKNQYTLEIVDYGYGMTRYEIEHYLLKAGASVYSEQEWKKIQSISMHGIGFMSAWMLADRLEVETLSLSGEKSSLIMWDVALPPAITNDLSLGCLEEYKNSGTCIRLLFKNREKFYYLKKILEESLYYGPKVFNIGTTLITIPDSSKKFNYIKILVEIDNYEREIPYVIPSAVLAKKNGEPLDMSIDKNNIKYYILIGKEIENYIMYNGLITKHKIDFYAKKPFAINIVALPKDWGLDLKKELFVIKNINIELFINKLTENALFYLKKLF